MSDSNKTHNGHRARFRQRFLENGTNGFSEHELLELLLFFALPRVNTNEIAHELKERFGTISAVLSAESQEISQINRLSTASAVFIRLVGDMCRRYSESNSKINYFASQEDIENSFSSYFSKTEAELCLIFSIGSDFEVLGKISLPAKSLYEKTMTSREIVEIVLKNNIHRIILGLNHPGKLPIPDQNDYAITNFLTSALAPIGIDIYDCIVCGENGRTFSMRRNGAFSFSEGDDML